MFKSRHEFDLKITFNNESLFSDEVFLFVGKQTDSQTYEDVPSAELFSLDGGCLPEVAPPPETDRHGLLTLIGEKIIYCLSKESNEGIIPYDSISCSGYNSSENKWDKNYTTTIGRNSRGSAQVYKNKIYFYQFFKHQCVVLDPTEGKYLDLTFLRYFIIAVTGSSDKNTMNYRITIS